MEKLKLYLAVPERFNHNRFRNMSTATETKPETRSVKASTPEKAKKETTPKLVCNVTGVARYTNATYLASKAKARNTDVKTLLANYVSRPVSKLLREGKSVTEIQGILGVTYQSPLADQSPEDILRLNGKQKRS